MKNELITLIVAISAAGLGWTVIAIWAVKSIVQSHLASVRQVIDDVLVEIRRDITQQQKSAVEMKSHQHTLEMDLLRLRGDMNERLFDRYVERREFEDLKGWVHEIKGSVEKLVEKMSSGNNKA